MQFYTFIIISTLLTPLPLPALAAPKPAPGAEAPAAPAPTDCQTSMYSPSSIIVLLNVIGQTVSLHSLRKVWIYAGQAIKKQRTVIHSIFNTDQALTLLT